MTAPVLGSTRASRNHPLLATLALLVVTAGWGSTFYLTKDLLDRVPVLDFLALGVLYGLAQILQTASLATTPASVSGFITGMYVVCTPLLAALLLKSRITAVTWGAVALATVGLGVLTLNGLSIGYGEAITLVAAVLYALHIVGLGPWSNARDAETRRRDEETGAPSHLLHRLGRRRTYRPRAARSS